MLTTSENSKQGISCIYVNYRSVGFLERSLQGLFLYETTVPFEVIVVNNDQQEQVQLEVLAKKYPLKIREAFHNPGFGTSANTGAQEAEGDILFFINPDTKWKESIFPEVKKRFEITEQLGALGIQTVSSRGIPEAKHISRAFTFSSPFGWIPSRSLVHWVSGGALFVPKRIFQELGGFDEQFFMYFEDMDFCLRLQQVGYQVEFDTEQQLIHFGGASHITKRSQKNLYDQSLYRYTKKHWTFFQYSLFRLFHPVYRFLYPYGRR